MNLLGVKAKIKIGSCVNGNTLNLGSGIVYFMSDSGQLFESFFIDYWTTIIERKESNSSSITLSKSANQLSVSFSTERQDTFKYIFIGAFTK